MGKVIPIDSKKEDRKEEAIHQHRSVQQVAAYWHLAFVVLNLGALVYHVWASIEHWNSSKL